MESEKLFYTRMIVERALSHPDDNHLETIYKGPKITLNEVAQKARNMPDSTPRDYYYRVTVIRPINERVNKRGTMLRQEILDYDTLLHGRKKSRRGSFAAIIMVSLEDLVEMLDSTRYGIDKKPE